VCPSPSTVSCGHRLDFRPSSTRGGHYSWTLSLPDLAYADDAAILMSDQLQADSVLQSFNAFTAPLGLVIVVQDKTPKRGYK